MNETFAWTASLSAPKEYPIEIYQGTLRAGQYDQSLKDWGVVNPGWGQMFGTQVSGPVKKPAPDRLNVIWLSFVENTFFAGEFALPTAKIAALLKRGFTNDMGKPQAYTNLVIGFAPEGMVSLWVMGPGHSVLVEQFQARKTIIAPQSVADHDAYMFREGYAARTLSNGMIMTPEIKTSLAASGYPDPTNYAGRYAEKYRWKPVFVLYGQGKPDRFGTTLFNGEMDKLAGKSLLNAVAEARALPRHCYVYWKTGDGEKHVVKVLSFDEAELYDAFAAMDGAPAELMVDVAAGNKVTVSVRSADREIVLTHLKIKAQ